MFIWQKVSDNIPVIGVTTISAITQPQTFFFFYSIISKARRISISVPSLLNWQKRYPLYTCTGTVSIYSREVPVQRGYRFCQFSKEGTGMDIYRSTILGYILFKVDLDKLSFHWFHHCICIKIYGMFILITSNMFTLNKTNDEDNV